MSETHSLTPSEPQTVTQPGAGASLARVAPRHVVREVADGYELEFELPGVLPGNVKLDLEGRVLSLEATPSEIPIPEGAQVLRREFGAVQFAGRWRLPREVDEDGIQTLYRAGLLTVTLPRRAQNRRTIPVLES